MADRFARTELLVGSEALEKIAGKKVAVFGVGGVGGFVCEALCRSGVGKFLLVDDDTVNVTNINRQIIALESTIGRPKTEVMRERMLDINPEASVEIRNCFFLPENADTFDFSEYDYVVDAVDTVTAKLAIIMKAKECGVPVISAMGAGNKLDPTGFKVADIYETTGCPLARIMRKELKKRGVESLKVVYSDEKPLEPLKIEKVDETDNTAEETVEVHKKRSTPGSIAFVPSVCGLIIASEVVKDLMEKRKTHGNQ